MLHGWNRAAVLVLNRQLHGAQQHTGRRRLYVVGRLMPRVTANSSLPKMRHGSRAVTTIFAAILAAITPASQAIADAFPELNLPGAYAGQAEFVLVTEDAEHTWKRVDFETAESYLWLRLNQVLPGVGESLMEVRYNSLEESVILYTGEMQAVRSDRFAKTLTDAGEIDLTPMPIVRTVRKKAQTLDCENRGPCDDGAITYRLSDKTGASPGHSEIDVLDGKVLRYRANERSGGYVLTVVYDDWASIPDSPGLVPTVITSRLWTPGSDDVLTQRISVRDVRALHSQHHPDPPPIPSTYTLIDHLTNQSSIDGEPIGQLETTPSGHSQTAAGAETLSKWMLWGGIGLVVVAGLGIGVWKPGA